MPDDAMQRLLDERDIGQALVRIARAMDARDWAALDSIIADDAEADFGTGALSGREAIIAIFREYLDPCGTTQHLLGNVLISVEGDQATSSAYVHDVHLANRPALEIRYYTLGDYRDRWERRAGAWWLVERIKHNRAHVGSMDVFVGS